MPPLPWILKKRRERDRTPQPVVLALVEETVKEKKRRKKSGKPHSSHEDEVKDTPGDCAVSESWNGRRVLNTVDSTYKIFVDGAWRTILVW